MKKSTIINNAPVSMNITTDLNSIIALVRSHGYKVYLPRKAEPTTVDIENGKKIKALRKSMNNMRQKEFAEKIHRAPNYVSLVETGKVRVSFRFAQAVYEAFRVYPDIKFVEKEKETNITHIA